MPFVISDKTAHKALAYIAAVSSQGYGLTVDELETYVESSNRRNSFTLGVASWFDPEPVHVWLARLHWIEVTSSRRVQLILLGQKILNHLDQEDIQDSTTALVLDPDQPFNYARVIGQIADCGDALLVDPYFRLEQLQPIVNHTRVRRVLTSDRVNSTGLAELAMALEEIRRPLEVRIALKSVLHDRYIIPPNGRVLCLGTSLNQVGKKFTLLIPIPSPAADAVREYCERQWESAQTPPRDDNHLATSE